MDYKKMYAWLLGAIDDALTLMDSGDTKGAYEMLISACQTCEDAYIASCDDSEDE